MQKFNVGQHVKFKNDTTGFRLYLDQKFEVVGYPLDSNDRVIEGQVLLEGVAMQGIMSKTSAFNEELDLILPDVVNTGIASGVGDWMQSRASEVVETGVELAIDLAQFIPKSLPTISNPFKSGGGGDFGGAGASGSWTDPIVETATETVKTVVDSTSGVLASVVDTAGSCASAVSDTIGSVAEVAGDVCSGIADAASSIDL